MKRLLSLWFVLGFCTPALAAEAPNVVLVMADDQGWGDMAYYGHPHLVTPQFDRFASEGIRFDQFHSASPVCSPTRGSVLAGRNPNRFACFSWGHPIRPQEITIAQKLKAAGYRTGHFGKWHLGSVQKEGLSTPGKCGFDTWISAPNFFDLNPILSVQGKATPYNGDSSDVTAELALQYMRECAARKERFLAVVWFGSPHAPHQALESDRKPYADRPKAEQNFYGEITAMDRAFGAIRSEIEKLGLKNNTILWYCSDNGALPKIGSSGGRRGQKASIYEGGLLVPSILEWPARFPKSQIVSTPCVTSDILPTVLELTGTPTTGLPVLDGVSLVSLLEGKAQKRSKPIGFWNIPVAGLGTPSKEWMEDLLKEQSQGREPQDPKKLFVSAGKITDKRPTDSFPGHSAWLDHNWKLHRIQNPSGNVKWELYDLAEDPKEARDLLEQESSRVGSMKRELNAWLTSVVQSLNGEDYK